MDRIETFGAAIGALVLVALVVGAFLLLSGWFVMLALGVLWSVFHWPQTVSFWQGVSLVWPLVFLGGFFRTSGAAKFTKDSK